MPALPKGMSQRQFDALPTTRAIKKIIKFMLYQMKIQRQNMDMKWDKVYAYQKGRRGVDESDLWYGKIESLRVDKRAKASQPFWVKIRWYWSADFQEPSFKKASQLDSRFFCMGSQELLESDLSEWMEAAVLADTAEVVKFDEISGVLKPWDGLYTRWSTRSSPPKLQTRRSNGFAQIATGGIISDVLSQLTTKWMNFSKHSFAVRLNVVSQLEFLEMDGQYIRHGNGTSSW
ncbi:hypothetical protein EV702DRAFT_1049257 [Suillus placidus]|uniref:Uncharacterized protein n=1 Tax=Suillus placidus TaxID=48579 RepID=A0A9P6ZLM5_9AGAM|nr:hypothetical protein EV702DRAFT_1049257 [Suillus placidus]